MTSRTTLTAYFQRKVPSPMGGMRYNKASLFTLDLNQKTITNLTEATMSREKKGKDRINPQGGAGVRIRLNMIRTITLKKKELTLLLSNNKVEMLRARNSDTAQEWCAAIKEAFEQDAQPEKYSPVHPSQTAASGLGKKSGILQKRSKSNGDSGLSNQPPPQPQQTRSTTTAPNSTFMSPKELRNFKPQALRRGKSNKRTGSRGFTEVDVDKHKDSLLDLNGTQMSGPPKLEAAGDSDLWIPPPPPPEEDDEDPPPSGQDSFRADEPKGQESFRRPPPPKTHKPTTYKMPQPGQIKFDSKKSTLIISGGTDQKRLTHLRTGLNMGTAITHGGIQQTMVPSRTVVRPAQTGRLPSLPSGSTTKTPSTKTFLTTTITQAESLISELRKKLDKTAVEAIVDQMVKLKVKDGDDIITQGQSNDKFFIVESGEVGIYQKVSLKNALPNNELSVVFEGSSYSMMMNASSDFTRLRATHLSSSSETREVKNPAIKPQNIRTQTSDPAPKSRSSFRMSGKFNAVSNTSKTAPTPSRDKKPEDETQLSVAKRGDFLAEIALLYEEPSTVSVRGLKNAVVWYIDRNRFHTISALAAQRELKEKRRLLDKTGFLSTLNDTEKDALTDALECKTYADGEPIIRCGENIDMVFWIKEGKVAVYNERVDLENLRGVTPVMWKAGDNFGELALFQKQNSEHDFISMGKTIVFELNLAEAEDIVGEFKELLKKKLVEEKESSMELEKQFSLFDESGLTKLQRAVDNIQNTIRQGFTARMSAQTQMSDSFRDEMGDDELMFNAIDLEYDEVPPLLENVRLDDFAPVQFLGKGCYGSVHLMRKVVLQPYKIRTYESATRNESITIENQFFALKAVARYKEDDAKYQEGLDNEIQAWAELSYMTNSPFVTSLYHSFTDEFTVFFLMDWCPGGTLYRLIVDSEGRRLQDPAIQKFYMANVVLGLEAIHKRSIIFRDLKPENIMVGTDGYLKITDFGLCKKSLRTYTVCGTPDYISPEVIISRGHDTASDLWALGVLLFEMAIGHPPFPGRDYQDKYEAILQHRAGHFPGLEKSGVEIYHDQEECERRIQQLTPTNNVLRDTQLSDESGFEDVDDLPSDVVFVPNYTWDFINRLMEPRKSRRLGCMASGYGGIKRHDFFGNFDWERIAVKGELPPFLPEDSEAGWLEHLETNTQKYSIELNDGDEEFEGRYDYKVNTTIDGEATFKELFDLDI